RQLRDESRALFSAHTQDKERLKELARYLDVFDSSRDAMLVMDQQGSILFANPTAARLSHRAAGQLIGLSFDELTAERDRPRAKEIVRLLRERETPGPVDLLLAAPAPVTIVSVNFSRVLGESEAILATMRDVS